MATATKMRVQVRATKRPDFHGYWSIGRFWPDSDVEAVVSTVPPAEGVRSDLEKLLSEDLLSVKVMGPAEDDAQLGPVDPVDMPQAGPTAADMAKLKDALREELRYEFDGKLAAAKEEFLAQLAAITGPKVPAPPKPPDMPMPAATTDAPPDLPSPNVGKGKR